METTTAVANENILQGGASSISIIILTKQNVVLWTVQKDNGEFFLDSFQSYIFSSQNFYQTRPTRM